MRKVKLRMNEQEKYLVIKELVDHGGNKNRAALKLGVTKRHINRLIQVYKKCGKEGFVHGNRFHTPSNSIPQESANKIIELYSTKYQDFNFCHFLDKLKEVENIFISYGTLYKLLIKAGFISPKAQKSTRKRLAKEKYRQQHPKQDIKHSELDVIINHQIAIEDAHPRKERCKYFGEEIQMDGSIHHWIKDEKWCLHLAIDNSTGIIVGAYFDKEETLNGYYHITNQFFKNYGVPYRIKTDKRTVFIYESSNNKTDEKDTLTQYGYMCKQLGIELETTSVSQAKGLVERANGTFQGRLVNELKLHDIKDIDKANEYLINTFVPDINKKFADPINSVNSVFTEPLNEQDINLYLSIHSTRKIDSGNAIKYKNKYYLPYDENGNLVCFKPKTECLVTLTFNKDMYVSIDDSIYVLKEIQKRQSISKDIDLTEALPKPKKQHIPTMSHPWKRASYVAFRNKAHKFRDYS